MGLGIPIKRYRRGERIVGFSTKIILNPSKRTCKYGDPVKRLIESQPDTWPERRPFDDGDFVR